MQIERIAYNQIKIGPGGRKCSCCADIPRDQKRRDHKAARRFLKRNVIEELEMMDVDKE